MDRIRIHPDWTNTVQAVHEFTRGDLIDGDKRAKLRAAFTDRDVFKPTKTRAALTPNIPAAAYADDPRAQAIAAAAARQ
jgi:hypothetical protein